MDTHPINKGLSALLTCLLSAGCCLSLSVCTGCGRGNDSDAGKLPDNFLELSDAQRMEAVMKAMPADSTAHFLINAALGKIAGARIDTLALATLYAFENYPEVDAALFSSSYDDYAASLPLNDKMRLYAMIGKVDAQQMGYQLGLEYVGYIRDNQRTPDEIEAELKAFKTACGDDKDTYTRFLKGFKAVLAADHGADLPKGIYERFINYE